MWNKDERTGRIEAVGALTGNDRLKAEGRTDEIKVRTAAGGARRATAEAIARAGKVVKR